MVSGRIFRNQLSDKSTHLSKVSLKRVCVCVCVCVGLWPVVSAIYLTCVQSRVSASKRDYSAPEREIWGLVAICDEEQGGREV